MPLATGTRLGSYEIVSPLGAGGMGEVYRAQDLELGRIVAVKVLRPEVAQDSESLQRFRTEGQLLASLNHPHIGQIYGIAEGSLAAGSTVSGQTLRGLVLELVEGETIEERATRGAAARTAPRVREALAIARQIADALDAAHAQGIVHRDLKPANIKITPAGVVKVLDFGVAKITSDARKIAPLDSAASGEQDQAEAAAQTRTLAAPATREGLVIGTPSYMSPEQARGFPVDKRTDVWAFGCVLYELLTGSRAFEGTTTADTVAAVLERQPDWSRLPGETPPGVRQILQRCLQKDPAQRLRDIGDVRLLIDDELSAPAGAAASESTAPSRARWTAAVAVAVLLAALAGVWLMWGRPPLPSETVRVSISTPGAITPQLSATISPDGRQLAFVATDASGRAMLWVRNLDQLQAREIPGTERAAHPFWSPDGKSLGFIADGQIKRVDLATGTVQTIVEAGIRNGPAWGPDGTILFVPRSGQLAAVPASGGRVTTVLTADPAKEQTALFWPRFLPDGRHFIYVAMSRRPEHRGIYVGSLDSKETRFLVRSDLRGWYAPPGYLIFPREETLMAQPFDATTLELRGEPAPIADGIWFARLAAQASFSVSETGALAYVNASLWDAELAWFDRGGRPLGPLGPPDRYAITPQISPDGQRVAVGRGEFGREDNWVIDALSGTRSRLTFSGAGTPVWDVDGRRLMYSTGPRVLVKDVVSGEETVVLESAPGRVVDWSRDARFVLFEQFDPDTDLWTVRLDPDHTPLRFTDTPYNEAQAQLSPDGRWVAYTANETGRDEVYVQSFPMPGLKRQVSPDGGAMPRWRRDGSELFYLASNQFITVVPVKSASSLELGAPVPLFRTRLVVQGSESTGLPTAYDVAPDGQRFLLRYPPADPGPPITVVLNWIAALDE